MRFIWICAKKDLIRLLRDPLAPIVWIFMPAMITALLSAIFGQQGAIPRGRLLIVDQDQSFVSRAVPGMLTRGQLSKMITVEHAPIEDGRKRLDRGNASALLIIPKGFGTAVLRNGSCRLTLLTNPSQRILPQIIRESLSTLVEGGFYVQKLLASELAVSGSDQDIARTSAAMRNVSRKISGYLNPPLISLKTTVLVDPNEPKPGSFGALFFPGMLILSMVGLAQAMSADLWREHDFGSLRRFAATPRHIATFLAGKLVAVLLLDAAIVTLGVVSAIALLHLSSQGQLLGILWVAIAGAGLYALMAVVQVSSSTARGGQMVSLFVLFLFSMMGGTFFPFELMPDWLAKVGRFTPNGWAVVEYKRIIAGSTTAVEFLFRLAAVMVVTVVALYIVARRLRRKFA